MLRVSGAIYDVRSEIPVRHDYTQEEKDSMREKLTANILFLDEIEDEKKEVLSSFKDRAEPMKSENKTLKRSLKAGYEESIRECGGIKDYESGMIAFYDLETAEEVFKRRMYPEERQMNLRS